MIFDAQKLKVNGSVDFKKRHNEFENIYLIFTPLVKKKKNVSHQKYIYTFSRTRGKYSAITGWNR